LLAKWLYTSARALAAPSGYRLAKTGEKWIGASASSERECGVLLCVSLFSCSFCRCCWKLAWISERKKMQETFAKRFLPESLWKLSVAV
jgi:hypothetical protein